MKKDHQNPGDVYDAEAMTPELALALLASELQLARQLEQDSALHLAMALRSDLEPELQKVLVSESQKALAMASDWVKEMEMVLAKAQELVKARHSQNC
jgi:hypothetical protein